jgi:ribosome biogenesis GTPase A
MPGMFTVNHKKHFFSINLSILTCYHSSMCTSQNTNYEKNNDCCVADIALKNQPQCTRRPEEAAVLSTFYVINLFVSFHYHYDEYVDTLDSPISLICSTESKSHKSVVATTMSTLITCTTITSNNILELKKDPGIPRLPNLKLKTRVNETRRAPPPSNSPDPDVNMASDPTSSARKHFIRTLHKLIDQSDLVLLVLDARDPNGCRSRLVEEEVRRREETDGKKLIFVLNKIDLIPRANAQSWLRYLRHTTPTLPFRSTTSAQRTHLSSTTAPALLRMIKAYKPHAQSITVGVVGYPNVGKSSLINSLKRAKVCPVAAQPGHTRDLQSVQLERGIRIVDSPGVIFDDDHDGHDAKGVMLRNVVRVEDVDDPIAVVEEILARTDAQTLRDIYNLPPFTSTLEFLTMLALTTGRLLKVCRPLIYYIHIY